ncbi:MAG: glycosylase, partial [Cyclobacteriaceae bacterium]
MNSQTKTFSIVLLLAILCSCKPSSVSEADSSSEQELFPEELTSFVAHGKNPLFTGTGGDSWDEVIRERGYILKENDGYHMWYTGYKEATNEGSMALGYATSPDGIVWTRYPGNPIFSENWVEDMMVVKHDSLYFMFAEGKGDIAHLMTSSDKVNWKDHGSLQIQAASGEPLTPGPYGTPTVFIEEGVWHLFNERNDDGIWVATSIDLKVW